MSEENALYLVQTTVDSEDQAQRLAQGLVEGRLAACVNIGPPSRSVYVWQGQLETTQEWVLNIKTSQQRLSDVHAWLAAHHPYDVPEILAMRVDHSANDYSEWVVAATDKQAQRQ